MKGIRLIPDGTTFDFVGLRFFALALSVVITVGSLGLTFTKGLNFGIDFTGGTVIEVRVPDTSDLAGLRSSLNALDLGDVSLQEFGEENDLMIRLPQQDGGEDVQQAALKKIHAALDGKFGADAVEYRRTEFVGPQVGEDLKKSGALAVLWSIIGILVYVWFRFEWQFGVAAIAALLHDVIATIGFFVVTQMQFDLSTVAAILTIAGYSTNDTVVVFDRIREMLRKYKKMPLSELLNMAVNQTLSRTVLTGGSTLLALAALWLFGGEVVQGFVAALVFGILIGTFSSIFVAAPILLYLNLRREVPGASGAEAQEQAG